MLSSVSWTIWEGTRALESPMVRYGLLERVGRVARENGVVWLAFGLGGDEVRLVFDGCEEAVSNVTRGIKVGTIRALEARGIRARLGRTRHSRFATVEEAVTWAHRAPLLAGATGPLVSPWSSHRDLLGYRIADFFDARALRRRVSGEAVHDVLGGRELPRARGPRRDHPREPLSMLLRLAAATKGVLPADRRCFRLFVHLGKARGWPTEALAEALHVTGRRVRQLGEAREPLIHRALRSLADPRLCCVP